MDVILIVVAGAILALLFFVSLLKMVGNRIQSPVADLREEISVLKQRIETLENKQK